MASRELMHEWNKFDQDGSIQPPLTSEEVDALTRYDVTPQTRVAYGSYAGVARAAFILCGQHFRIDGNPELTAQTVAAFK